MFNVQCGDLSFSDSNFTKDSQSPAVGLRKKIGAIATFASFAYLAGRRDRVRGAAEALQHGGAVPLRHVAVQGSALEAYALED